MNTNYTNIAKGSKLAARDILRTKKVSTILGKISGLEVALEAEKKNYEESLARLEKKALIAEVEAAHMPEEHPNKEEATKKAVELREKVTKEKEAETKYFAETEKAINEDIKAFNEKIEKWHTGENKVDKDELKDMASKLIEKYLTEAFLDGEYETEVATAKTA